MPVRVDTDRKRIGRIISDGADIATVYSGSTLIYSAFQDGSLVIEDDTLDVSAGEAVNLRVKLGSTSGKQSVTVMATASEASNLISISPATSRIFTQANWDTYQIVHGGDIYRYGLRGPIRADIVPVPLDGGATYSSAAPVGTVTLRALLLLTVTHLAGGVNAGAFTGRRRDGLFFTDRFKHSIHWSVARSDVSGIAVA